MDLYVNARDGTEHGGLVSMVLPTRIYRVTELAVSPQISGQQKVI